MNRLTQRDYSQYRALKAEIRSLERQISKQPSGNVTDYAYDYKSGKAKTVILNGQADEAPRNRLRTILQTRKENAENLLIDIQKEISGIEDNYTRFVISEYYCMNKNFKEIAFDLGFRDEKQARRIRDRYFSKKLSEKAENVRF